MKRDVNPQVTALRADALIAESTDPVEKAILLDLKQHAWDLAVCVQQLRDAFGGDDDTGRDRRRTD